MSRVRFIRIFRWSRCRSGELLEGWSCMCLERRGEDDGLGFGGSAFANRADTLRGFEFHRYAVEIERHCFSKGFADGKPVVFELWPLEDYGGIHVHDLKS